MHHTSVYSTMWCIHCIVIRNRTYQSYLPPLRSISALRKIWIARQLTRRQTVMWMDQSNVNSEHRYTVINLLTEEIGREWLDGSDMRIPASRSAESALGALYGSPSWVYTHHHNRVKDQKLTWQKNAFRHQRMENSVLRKLFETLKTIVSSAN